MRLRMPSGPVAVLIVGAAVGLLIAGFGRSAPSSLTTGRYAPTTVSAPSSVSSNGLHTAPTVDEPGLDTTTTLAYAADASSTTTQTTLAGSAGGTTTTTRTPAFVA